MRPIRNPLARIAAIAALLLTLSIASTAPALGWDGQPDSTIGVTSIDDGGIPQPLWDGQPGSTIGVTSVDDGGIPQPQ